MADKTTIYDIRLTQWQLTELQKAIARDNQVQGNRADREVVMLEKVFPIWLSHGTTGITDMGMPIPKPDKPPRFIKHVQTPQAKRKVRIGFLGWKLVRKFCVRILLKRKLQSL